MKESAVSGDRGLSDCRFVLGAAVFEDPRVLDDTLPHHVSRDEGIVICFLRIERMS